jgi:hypothetical protein
MFLKAAPAERQLLLELTILFAKQFCWGKNSTLLAYIQKDSLWH